MNYLTFIEDIIDEFILWSGSLMPVVAIHDRAQSVLYCYTEVFRRYHNLSHVINVVDAVNRSKSVDSYKRIQLKMAALYHDAIYRIGDKNNEKNSAEFFSYCYKGWVADEFLKDIYDMIVSTKKTPWDEMPDCHKVLVDADWADFDNVIDATRHMELIKEEVLNLGFSEFEFYKGSYKFFNSIYKKHYKNNKDNVRLKNIGIICRELKGKVV